MEPVVLLIADERATAERWSAWLGATANCAWRRPSQTAHVEADVVVWADDSSENSDAASGCRVDGRGLVVVGSAARPTESADAWLPEDVNQREFVQTVLLVAQIANLRRQNRAYVDRQRLLADLAAADPLTGLANRRTWDDELPRRWRAAADCGGPLCLAIFDVDHFKPINDERGHAAGDEVLRRAGDALKTATRAGDLAARLGGDEFGLLAAGVPPAEAERAVEWIRLTINERLSSAASGRITVSAGCAVVVPGNAADAVATPGGPGQVSNPAELEAAADAALRAAKAAGRDRTCSASG